MADTKISLLTEKTTPVDADQTNILDSEAADADKRVSFANLRKALSLTHTAAVFVAKVGSDSNTGLRIETPMLTIGAAITAASALISGGATGVRVHVLDGGTYTEDITVPTAISIDAKGATLVGTASITGGSELFLDRHFAASNNQTMLTLEGAGTGPAIYAANISDGRGSGGALTGTNNVRNIGGGGRNLFVHVGILYVAASGTGVGDVSSGDAGHIHINIPDLYLAGNSAVGILGSSQGTGDTNIVGWVDHLLEIGTPTTTTGISITSADAVVKLVASEIVADTAYNIAAGSLYLACPKITGTETGTPVNKLLGTSDGVALKNVPPTEITGLSDDVNDSDNGLALVYSNVAGCAVTLANNATAGTNAMLIADDGAGSIDIVAEAGGSLKCPSGTAVTITALGTATVYCRSNSGGNNAVWFVGGDVGATA